MKQLTPEQLDRMKPESRERYEQRLRIVKRNRKIRNIVCAVVLVIAAATVLSMTVLFNITEITVAKAGANYTAEEIINASGLNVGDNMVLNDINQAAERIQTNLPYVLEAQISAKPSGKVTITIKDTAAAILIELKQGYAIADIHGKVLENIEEKPENNTFLVLKTRNSIDTVPGIRFNFASGQEESLYNQLVSVLNEVGLFESITAIDISDYSSVKIEYQNRLRILLGSADELDVKLKSCVEVIKTEDKKDPALIAEVNCTIPKKVFVNPLDSLNPEDEEPADEPVEEPTTDSGEETTGQSEPVTQTGTTEPEETTSQTQTTTEDTSETSTSASEENEENR